MKKYMGNKLAIFLFILPALAIFIIFDMWPIVQVFTYSFTQWNGLTTPTFTGLENYIELFNDRVFFTSNRNQLIFALVITVYQISLATIFAITISDKKLKGRKFLRVVYFVPVILSVTVVCQLWSAILSGDGLLNKIFEVSGSSFRQNWLGDRYKAIYVISFVNAWQWMGYQFALIVAGIKSIPTDYYEAARIDGCSLSGTFFKIILPLMKPAVSTVGVYSYLQCWNEFMFANVFISDSAHRTLPVGIKALSGQHTTDWGPIGAALVIATFPTLIFYLFLSRKIQQSFIAGAVKG